MTNDPQTPGPQRRSGAVAGILVLALVAIIGVGIVVMWASPWDDDTDQDPSLPGFQEEPTIAPGDDNSEAEGQG